ncbi:20051_t:CDS:1, partial [Racocetra fulgida]
KEFFTQLLEILEAAVKKLEEQEQLEVELQEIKREKQTLETQLTTSESTLNQLKEKLTKQTSDLEWQTLNLEACQILSNFLTKALKNSENITKRGEELKQKIREGKNSNPHILEEQIEEMKTSLYQEIDKITSFVLEKEGSEGKLKELEEKLAGLVASSGLLSQQ